MSTQAWGRRLCGGMLVVAIGLFAAACGATAPTAGVTATPTLTPVGRATPSATADSPGATAPTAIAESPGTLCGTSGGSPVTASNAGPNDVIHSLRFVQLPNDWPQAPHTLPTGTQYPEITIGSNVELSIPVSIGAATQPGIICGVTVRIESFQPLAGPLPNVYHPCVGQWYLDPGGFNPTTACPSFFAPVGSGSVTLASSSAGSATTAGINGYQNYVADPSQPARVSAYGTNQPPPYVGLGVTVPAAGTYTFAISLWQDLSGPGVHLPAITQTLVFNQALYEWSGSACTTPAMQSRLPPPTNPPTSLICPGPPPQ
jgi:hypothetical protein